MASVEEKLKPAGFVSGGHNVQEGIKLLKEMNEHTGTKKHINSELWHACAGPLVTLPQVGGLVYYFPQGHSEQVAVSTNRTATAQVPNYPNLPPQLLCQVHNVILNADKETDEIYAQMSLQPVNSEKDMISVPGFGSKPSKHPTEFFCKTLTASDTSTHGGFSVPRRSAEKLFPQLDYTMQPPTQELVVRDLHDNTWTFRHIYRGQPKRHLLTTGWSMFVGSKRLRAGDSVLFIRDEKSQLLLGVRRLNRQQTALPSSVLSADSMHIGILAAAAHAASSRSPFTIFYNPRACPADFVVPFAKYQKAVYSTQLSIGMRFGMMFETEESSKRRYMGTITGISDVDPLGWPNSRWRSLQVEWDEPGCGDRRNRVSPWEIETPESIFIFPSLTGNFKRPFHSAFIGGQTDFPALINRPSFLRNPENTPHDIYCPSISTSMWSDQLVQMLLMKPPHSRPILPPNLSPIQHEPHGSHTPESFRREPTNFCVEGMPMSSQFRYNEEKSPAPANPGNPSNLASDLSAIGPHNPCDVGPHAVRVQEVEVGPVVQPSVLLDEQVEFLNQANHQQQPALPEVDESPLVAPPFLMGQESWDPPSFDASHDILGLQYSPCDLKDLPPVENHSGSAVIDPSVFEDFCSFQNPCEYVMGSLCSNQDVQSQITTASLADSQNVSRQEYAENSSSNVDFEDNGTLLQQHGSWKQVTPRFRTYTKIQKAGSVGRSIDVSSFGNYDELRSDIERMFGLEGLLNDYSSGWKLVYVDFENDVLLVGDDPWEEFVGCVKCIRILSPPEVQQMGEEGMQLLNSVQGFVANALTSEVGCI